MSLGLYLLWADYVLNYKNKIFKLHMKTYSKLSIVTSLSLAGSSFLLGGDSVSEAVTRADAHAPIGVMGDHTHLAGEWMLSYRHMTMLMDQIYRGSDEVDGNMAETGYMVSPREMTMDMDMLGLMYAPTDRLTMLLMTSYKKNKMTMNNMAGVESMRMRSEGMGDTSVGGLYQFFRSDDANAHVSLAVSLPTGETGKKVISGMPAAVGRDQPFPMQLGSGTFDFIPGVTFNHFVNEHWSWGGQLKATLRTGENDDGYRLGDAVNLTVWGARNVGSSFSFSGRLNAKFWSGYEGFQSNGLFSVNGMMSLPADPSNSGGARVDGYFGVNYVSDYGLRVALEVGKSFWQDLDGVQLGMGWSGNLGLQYAF